MMKTTKEFWSRKQFTDSSSIELWMSSKQQQQQQLHSSSKNIAEDIESASAGGKTNNFNQIFRQQIQLHLPRYNRSSCSNTTGVFAQLQQWHLPKYNRGICPIATGAFAQMKQGHLIQFLMTYDDQIFI